MFWVGTRKGLFAMVDGVLVSERFTGLPVTMVLAQGERVWVALEHGHYGPKLHRSTDGGDTFIEVACPALPAGGDASVSTLFALERGSDGRLWCGTVPGALFTSTDDGDSWQLVESLWNAPERERWFGGGTDDPGLHSIAIHPEDPDDVVIAVSCGGVWRTRDGGASWALTGAGMVADFMPPERASDPSIQDPHRVVRSARNPDIAWCQHHCGAYRSEDAGDTWSALDIPPSSFGFAVAVHPEDPDTAWFVPAVRDDVRIPVDGRVVVARTRDAGASFEVLREGLPQQWAYDLVYRHALAVDGAGNLAFGSTTGSLWTSTDGGDSWHTVSTHLPPVYVVTAHA